MQFTSWQLKDQNINYYPFRIQVEDINNCYERSNLLKIMKYWSLSAEYSTPKYKNKCLVFQKVFKSIKEWKIWLSTFPWEIEEINDKTNKRIKLWKPGGKSQLMGIVPRETCFTKKRCKKCGNTGHNSRTCIHRDNPVS